MALPVRLSFDAPTLYQSDGKMFELVFPGKDSSPKPIKMRSRRAIELVNYDGKIISWIPYGSKSTLNTLIWGARPVL